MPSHVDLAGNEHAGNLADEVVRKHGVGLAADGKEKRHADKRPAQQKEEQERQEKRRSVEGGPQQPNPNLPSLPLSPTQNAHQTVTPVQVRPYLTPDPPLLGQSRPNQSSSSSSPTGTRASDYCGQSRSHSRHTGGQPTPTSKPASHQTGATPTRW